MENTLGDVDRCPRAHVHGGRIVHHLLALAGHDEDDFLRPGMIVTIVSLTGLEDDHAEAETIRVGHLRLAQDLDDTPVEMECVHVFAIGNVASAKSLHGVRVYPSDLMNKEEALRVLEQELNAFRGESYEELAARINPGPIVSERTGQNSTVYQLEIQVVWDGPKGGNVRAIGSVDDGSWRALVPITRSFIKSADGRFVGE